MFWQYGINCTDWNNFSFQKMLLLTCCCKLFSCVNASPKAQVSVNVSLASTDLPSYLRIVRRFYLLKPHLFAFLLLLLLLLIINPLTARVIGTPQMILQPVFSTCPCSTLPSGTCRTQACPVPDVVFPRLPLSALSSSPLHCALQDGFGQTWWKSGGNRVAVWKTEMKQKRFTLL